MLLFEMSLDAHTVLPAERETGQSNGGPVRVNVHVDLGGGGGPPAICGPSPYDTPTSLSGFPQSGSIADNGQGPRCQCTRRRQDGISFQVMGNTTLAVVAGWMPCHQQW